MHTTTAPTAPLRRTVGRPPKSNRTDTGTRTAILSAARSVFARKGFSGTSVREVAESAKVNKALIYYYFKDKMGLYRSVLSDSFEAMQLIWGHKVFRSDKTAREKIQVYIEGFIRFQHQNEDLRRILAMEFSVTGEKSRNMKWIAKEYFSKNHATLARILEQGMKNGELKKMDPLLAVVSLIGMIIHVFIFMPIAPHVLGTKVNISAKKLGDFVTEIYFDGLARSTRVKRSKP